MPAIVSTHTREPAESCSLVGVLTIAGVSNEPLLPQYPLLSQWVTCGTHIFLVFILAVTPHWDCLQEQATSQPISRAFTQLTLVYVCGTALLCINAYRHMKQNILLRMPSVGLPPKAVTHS